MSHINLNRLTNDDNFETKKKMHTRRSDTNSCGKGEKTIDLKHNRLRQFGFFFFILCVTVQARLCSIFIISMVFFLYVCLKYYKIIRTVCAISISVPMWHLSHMIGLFASLTSFICCSFIARLSSKPFRLFLDKSNNCKPI